MDDSTYFVLVAVTVVLAGLVIVVSARNRIVRVANTIENAYGRIDVLLKRRCDLVPNLVEVVKGYAAHEQDTLAMVAQARGGLVAAKSPDEAHAADNVLSQALGRLLVVSERYPELKADARFGSLQAELVGTEDGLASARQVYNDVVLKFNDLVLTFPGNRIAGRLGGRRSMLQTSEKDRAVPAVKFQKA